jgi:DNA-binding CsgD family transcriptional regulator
VTTPTHPPTSPTPHAGAPDPGAGAVRSWPVLLLAAPAFVAIWSGWVGLGRLTGFGPVELLPGIWDAARINSAITLPVGMETYAAYALHVMLSTRASNRARTFARWSAIGSLVLGAAGQVAYHLMSAAGLRQAPWQITALVACLPVAVLGMGAALAHLVRDGHDSNIGDLAASSPTPRAVEEPAPSGSSPSAGTADAAPADAPKSAPRKASRARTAPTGTTTGRGTAAKVTRLKAKHPDMTSAEIARRLGVTDRTVRRYLASPTSEPTTTAITTEASANDARAA